MNFIFNISNNYIPGSTLLALVMVFLILVFIVVIVLQAH